MTKRAWLAALGLLALIGACDKDRAPSTTGGHTNWLPCTSNAECRDHEDAVSCKQGYCVDANGTPVVKMEDGALSDGGAGSGGVGSDGGAGSGGVGGNGSAGCSADRNTSGVSGGIAPVTPPEGGPCPTLGLQICTRRATGSTSTLAECRADGWEVIEDPSDCSGEDSYRDCRVDASGDGVCCIQARYCRNIGVCDGTRWWSDAAL